ETPWRLGAVGRLHLRADRRDPTWARLRKAELEEAEFADPDHGGLLIDNDARRELQAVTETFEPDELEGLEFTPSTRDATLAFLDKDPLLRTSVLARWNIGDLMGIVAPAEENRTQAELAGNFELVGLINIIEARSLALLSRHEEADAAMARAAANLPRLHPRSNAAFQYVGANSLIGYVRGDLPTYSAPEFLAELDANPETRWVTFAVVSANAYSAAATGAADQSLADVERALVGIELAPANAGNYGLIACLCVHSLWVLGRTDHLDVIEANIRSKLIATGLQYPEVVNELAVAQACALTDRVDEAREWVAEAHGRVAREGMAPLHVHIASFEAQWELRLRADGDPDRCRAAIERARAGCDDPAMAPWLPRLDALERDAATLWG
ncbi:MAG: hypothetical protein ABL966_11755, partial [Acidimicrobiales bacterium]